MQTELSNHASDRFPPPETRPAGLTAEALRRQNRVFRGTGGVSAGNRAQGFAPAFRDTRTGAVYRARFADGRPAPAHLLEGLPPALVVEHDAGGGATALHAAVTAGFVRGTRFFTCEQAALAMNRTSSARIGQSRTAMIAHPGWSCTLDYPGGIASAPRQDALLFSHRRDKSRQPSPLRATGLL